MTNEEQAVFSSWFTIAPRNRRLHTGTTLPVTDIGLIPQTSKITLCLPHLSENTQLARRVLSLLFLSLRSPSEHAP